MQVIIFGQPELEEKLNHPSIRQLKQRIAFEYCLTPMGRDEIDYYIQHRLTVAGHHGSRMFTRPAMWLLKRRTHCVPRLVNIVAHKSMLSAFGKGRKNVTFWDVRAAVNYTASMATDVTRVRLLFLIALLFASVCLLLIEKGYIR